MPVKFHKMHGLGNDFILLDLRAQEFPLNSHTVKQLANRHTGIGCDQLLVLREPKNDQHLAAFEIWNSDGSSCEQCGNGVRCMGRYLDMRAEAPENGFTLGGPAGTVFIECLDNGLVRVDMGKPLFESSRVPIQSQAVEGWYPLDLDGQLYRIGAVSMGNPHALLVVDDIRNTDVSGLGAALGSHPAFPEGCNMGFAEILERDHIELRVFERGAAETLACGSGACAAVSILRRSDMVDSTVRVTQAGGELIISWRGRHEPVIMTGPATHVFEGNLT